MTKKKYTSAHVDAVKGMRDAFGWSVRKIAKETGVPKSVIGRWTKEPKVWKQKYQITTEKEKIKQLSPKVRKQLRKAVKHVTDKDKPQRHTLRLTIHEEDDTYTFDYK